jgi:[ribosomal protein S5]-alanine N-acetyltransferase
MTNPGENELVIVTPRLTLRPLKPEDAEDVASILNHPDVGRMIRQISLPYLADTARAWLGTHAGERQRGEAFRFATILGETLIGCVDVDEIEDGNGELGFWFHPAHWGHGYAEEAARAVLRFAFDRLGLEKLATTHAVDNDASGRLLRKLGFRRVGETKVWSHSRRQEVTQITHELPGKNWLLSP